MDAPALPLLVTSLRSRLLFVPSTSGLPKSVQCSMCKRCDVPDQLCRSKTKVSPVVNLPFPHDLLLSKGQTDWDLRAVNLEWLGELHQQPEGGF